MSKRFRKRKEFYKELKRLRNKNNILSKQKINNALIRWYIHQVKYIDKMFKKAVRNSNSLTAHKLPLDKKVFDNSYEVFH